MDKSPIPEDGGGDRGGGNGNALPPQSSPDGAALSPSRMPPPECGTSRMPDFPSRNPGHRRAHSEIIGLSCASDGPSMSDDNEEELFSMFLDIEKLNSPFGASDLESSCAMAGAGAGPRPRHQHSFSMDVSSYGKTEQLLEAPAMEGMLTAEAKKAMSAAKLAELALVNPKKAKRIWANRQSAARSKERKMWYIADLEQKVQTLHTEATTLSTQLALLQRNTTGLTTENSELKMRLQNVEQQVYLQDALNDALKSELQHLKMATGQMGNGGGMTNFGGPPHSFGGNQQMLHHQNQAMQPLLATHQVQHLQIRRPYQQPPHPHQPLHPLYAQQLQQAALDLKMKGPMAAPGQWGDGWSESSGC